MCCGCAAENPLWWRTFSGNSGSYPCGGRCFDFYGRIVLFRDSVCRRSLSDFRDYGNYEMVFGSLSDVQKCEGYTAEIQQCSSGGNYCLCFISGSRQNMESLWADRRRMVYGIWICSACFLCGSDFVDRACQCLQIPVNLWGIQPSDGAEDSDAETALRRAYTEDGWDQQNAPWYASSAPHSHGLCTAGKIWRTDEVSAGVCFCYDKRGKNSLLLQKYGSRCGHPFLCRWTEAERDFAWTWYDASEKYQHFRYWFMQDLWESSGECCGCSGRTVAGKESLCKDPYKD